MSCSGSPGSSARQAHSSRLPCASVSERSSIMGSTATETEELENTTFNYLIGEHTEKMWQRLKGIKISLKNKLCPSQLTTCLKDKYFLHLYVLCKVRQLPEKKNFAPPLDYMASFILLYVLFGYAEK